MRATRIRISCIRPIRTSGASPTATVRRCAVDGFPYRGARLGLRPDEVVCLVSDGVTEAENPTGELYGRARLEALLFALRGTTLSANEIVEAIRADVTRFRAGAEPADDLTVLALRWRGVVPPLPPAEAGRGED